MNVDLSDIQIEELVESVVRQVISQSTSSPISTRPVTSGDMGVFDNMNDAVEAAHAAFLEYKERSIQCKKKITDAVRQMAMDHKEELAAMTVEETGMGRVDHKIAKFINTAKNSPGVEDLQPQAWSGRNGLAVDEYAPFGVIGNITPSTHPGPVMINNIIIQLVGGNTIAFNAHPAAKKVNAKVIQLANQYMVKAGAPMNLVTCVKEPTLETAKTLFAHKKVALLSVTGGPMMVDMALTSDKKVIAAGPGNPPVLIDETAKLALAAKEISDSSSFDNNVLCLAEKEIFVVDSVFDEFMREMEKVGNVRLSSQQMNTLGEKALQKPGEEWVISRDYVGKDAKFLANSLGLNVSDSTPLLFGETNADHPWVLAEQMTCCVPVIRVRNFEEGIQACAKAEHGFRHTSSVYTQDMNRASRYSRVMDCTLVVINGGSIRGNGGEGGEAYFSHTIATPTGEGICTPINFVRKRRIMTHAALRFV